MVKPTRQELLNKIEDLGDKLAESTTLDGQHRIISAFEGKIASLQYARAAIQQLDKDYGMESKEHIKVLDDLIEACRSEAKSARKALTLPASDQ